MNFDSSILMYFMNAGLVVKLVLILLISASVLSWSYIFERRATLRKRVIAAKNFKQRFVAEGDLAKLYSELKNDEVQGLENIFKSGFKEVIRQTRGVSQSPEVIMDCARRSMRVAEMQEQEKLELHLPFLATVGSVSPYIGLFGTVWGIMLSLRALSNVQQASIAMVAPGIAEALIATAIGLFAAIPAYIAYNRYSNDINRLMNQYEAFQEEFCNLLLRQIKHTSPQPVSV